MQLRNLVGKGGGDNAGQQCYDTDAHYGGGAAQGLPNVVRVISDNYIVVGIEEKCLGWTVLSTTYISELDTNSAIQNR